MKRFAVLYSVSSEMAGRNSELKTKYAGSQMKCEELEDVFQKYCRNAAKRVLLPMSHSDTQLENHEIPYCDIVNS